MLRGAKELWLAFAAAVVITAIYALVIFLTGNIPAAGEFYGHTLGNSGIYFDADDRNAVQPPETVADKSCTLGQDV